MRRDENNWRIVTCDKELQGKVLTGGWSLCVALHIAAHVAQSIGQVAMDLSRVDGTGVVRARQLHRGSSDDAPQIDPFAHHCSSCLKPRRLRLVLENQY